MYDSLDRHSLDYIEEPLQQEIYIWRTKRSSTNGSKVPEHIRALSVGISLQCHSAVFTAFPGRSNI